MKQSLLFLIIVHGFLSTQAQQFDIKFKHLTGEQGLSQNHVIHVMQDYQGFIWICTVNGLNKYDGYKITVYKNNPDDSTSISSNNTRYLCEDSNKNLWIATGTGLNLYDRKKDKFIRIKLPLVGGPINFIRTLFTDKKGRLWIGTDSQAYLYDIATNTLKDYFQPAETESPSERVVWSICQDKQQNIWLGRGGKLYRFDEKNNSFKVFAYEAGNDKSLGENTMVSALLYRRNGDLVVGTRGGGVNFFDFKTETFTHYKNNINDDKSISGDVVISLLEDSKGNLWVGTENAGLNLFHPETGTFSRYKRNIYDPQSVLNNSISTLCEDVSGNLWVGTHNGGISFCNPYKMRFMLFKQETDRNSLSHNTVKAFVEDKYGKIWIGTDGGGLNVWNRKTDSFTYYRSQPNNKKSISSDIILSAFQDSDEDFWFGTYEQGLNRLDVKTNTFTHYKVDPANKNGVSGNTAWSIIEDDTKNIWFATWRDGISMLDKKNNTFTHYRHSPNDPGSLSNDWTICLFIDSKHNLWVGTYWGLNLFNKKTKTFTRYISDKAAEGTISHSQINNIFEDSKGNLWVGTPGGLNLFDQKTKRFSVFTEKDGLPSDLIQSVQQDDHGNLWISTLKEISKFNLATRQFKNYTIDAIYRNEFTQNVSMKTSDGKIIFGGIHGFNIFHPDSIKDNDFIPPVLLTDFQVFNKSVPIGDNSPLSVNINEAKQITLSYNESVFSIEFAAFNYFSAEKNQYAYKMEGFDKDWNLCGDRRVATYTNLDPGKYTFRVKASNNDGVWNEKGTSVTINIIPPFWQRWWFRVIILCMLLGSVYAIDRIRVIKIQQQKKELARQVDERTVEVTLQKEKLETQSQELQTTNMELTEVNEELHAQRLKIETLYTEVRDSIRAAEVIQQSILPSKNFIQQYLPDFFVLNRPKDVVSGDFYWFDIVHGKIVVAAVDCTGHGVSGAFMSIKGHSLLSQNVHSRYELVASQILDSLNMALIKELHQRGSESGFSDGMDIALCVIDKEKKKLQFAGAVNSLYITRREEIIQVKGDRFSLGLPIKGKVVSFKNNEVLLEHGDIVYLFSDGYADQIGGPEGEDKFMYARFRELLLSIRHESMDRQCEILSQQLDEWKGSQEQLDDILVMGFKIDQT